MTNTAPDRPRSLIALRGALGSFPPRQLTQQAYEGNPRHLRRLVQLKPSDRAKIADLWEYTQDLLYTEIQSSLLIYLLPFCLEIWREDLLGTNQDAGGFVEQLYPVLANREIFTRHLKPGQTEAVAEFVRVNPRGNRQSTGTVIQGNGISTVSLDHCNHDIRGSSSCTKSPLE